MQILNTDLIRRAINMFDWGRTFVNTNVNEKVFILNKTILNILSNFILLETLTIDDKDRIGLQKNKKSHLREKKCLQKLSKY